MGPVIPAGSCPRGPDTYAEPLDLNQPDKPEGRSLEYGYDAAGRLAYRVDAEGHRVDYEYEENRLVKMIKPDGTSLEYTYEPYEGRMVTTHTRDEEGATEEFTYFPGYTEYRNPSGIPEGLRYSV